MNIALHKGFRAPAISAELARLIEKYCNSARGDILKMTTLAGSGHPGGSLSSLEMFMTLFLLANVGADDPFDEGRDRVVVSHGHTSPGVYATLGRLGFFPIDQAIAYFRKAGSPFEGHIERNLPGIEWSTGNLGQGLSAGCAFALASRIKGSTYQTYVVMGDGEQQKGQISEARRFAAKYHLSNLTVLIDYNGLQISGNIGDVMPQNIRGNFESDGWKVIEVDGHDVIKLYSALAAASSEEGIPVAIIAHTVMGKGVSFMENVYDYHGKALTEEQLKDALSELEIENDLEKFRRIRESADEPYMPPNRPEPAQEVDTGTPRIYGTDEKLDNRGAFGNALSDIAELNSCGTRTPIAVFDCDLAGSVKTAGFAKKCPHHFFESGIQEHHTAVMAGALSTTGILTFFADFGVFGICETYNQHRLNDINETNLKLACTHVGIDVGEDGKTHQCIDYIGLLRNIFGYTVIVPADPNQTDRAVRFMAREKGNFAIVMGRSKLPTITGTEGEPFFGESYEFAPGEADLIRDGADGTIITCGTMAHRAVLAWEMLREKGVTVKVFNMATPAIPDMNALKDAAETGLIVTYEDHNADTGLGSVIGDALATGGLGGTRFVKMGVTRYGGSGKPDDIYRELGIAPDQLAEKILAETASR